ncbi:MAG: hypothetical protein R3230_00040 [Nitrosopumilaceae archaeon]|nr:hypothetical protein [Nitrosopumilaceae archaeon]
MFTKIGIGTPINEEILLYWENSKHIEKATLHFDDDNEVYHVLSLDGECFPDEPTHWMHIPEVKE